MRVSQAFITLTAILFLGAMRAEACTIFVLTDSQRTLFFNNEDWSNPSTRIWFEPAGQGYYGAAYVGFNNGWAQGGVNTEGLAFDWVAGYEEEWNRDASFKTVRGNSSQRMLETCTTVDEAIAFYKRNWEPGFSYARIMIADKSGKSVITRAKEGQLDFDISEESRGFGYGAQQLQGRLGNSPDPSTEHGLPILQACMQEGQYATKYSTVYDLNSGRITLINFVGQRTETALELTSELAKGPHFYSVPDAASQQNEPPVPLEQNMKRFPADEYRPISETHPEVTRKITAVLEDAVSHGLQAADFEEQFWKSIEHAKDAIRQDIADLGRLMSITPVESGKTTSGEFLYRIEYEYAVVVQRFGMDDQNRISLIVPEVVEQKMK